MAERNSPYRRLSVDSIFSSVRVTLSIRIQKNSAKNWCAAPQGPKRRAPGYHGTSRVFRVRGCSVQRGTWCTALIHCTTRCFSTDHFALGRVPQAHTRIACLFRGGQHVYKVDHALIPFRTGARLFCEMNDAIFRGLARPLASRRT